MSAGHTPTEAPKTYIDGQGRPCFATGHPDWCNAANCSDAYTFIDREHGPLRIHGDVVFGDYLFGNAEEFFNAPGVLNYGIAALDINLAVNDPEGLRALAQEALAAADWLEQRRAEES